jgi:hypothetical protein
MATQASELSHSRPGLVSTNIVSTNGSCVVVSHLPKEPKPFVSQQKLNPLWWFGNSDEPTPPDWYRPAKSCRNVYWHLRNPCHNFNCYVIGISDKAFTRVGKFPNNTFAPDGGWNSAVCRYKHLRLPFISYSRGRFQCYFGWRTMGDFGIALRRIGSKKQS